MKRVLIPFDLRPPAPHVGAGVHGLQGRTMGTTWSVKVVAEDLRRLPPLQAGIERELNEVVAQMSTWEPDSALSRFNRAAENSWQALPEAFFRVLDYALQIAEDSGGAFDVAAGALVNLWGFGPARAYSDAAFTLPGAAEIEAARAACGWRRIEIDRVARRAKQGGVYLDFSAIAKGFAVDQVAGCLERNGIENYLVEIGGELRGAGVKPDAQPWWVAIETPPQADAPDTEAEIRVALHGLSVATSGDYRRYYEKQGDRYCHSIDPRSGFPIRNGVVSATVIHSDCMTADALSTALTVMGLEQGLSYADQRGIAARFLVRTAQRYTEHLSQTFAAMLQ